MLSSALRKLDSPGLNRAFVVTLFTLSFGLLGGIASAAAPSGGPTRPQNAPKHTAPAAVDACATEWRQVPMTPVEGNPNYLSSIFARAADDVWAVGYLGPFQAETLTVHWDGTQWDRVESPSPGTDRSSLHDVVALAPDDAWAVGETLDSPARHSLILHWDGSTWTQVDSPNPGSDANYLQSIWAVSPDDIWAVGTTKDDWTTPEPFIVHWDGTAWTHVPAPGVGTEWDHLLSVSGAAANDVWAVGDYRHAGGTEKTLVLHWDGTSWEVEPSPNVEPALNRNMLQDVVATSDGIAWATGVLNFNDGETMRDTALLLKWDGSTWAVVDHPRYSVHRTMLFGLSASGPDNVWATGFSPAGTAESERNKGLALHWDGATWSEVVSPLMAEQWQSSFGDVSVLSSNDVWAIGGFAASPTEEGYGPKMLRYSTVCDDGSPTPTRTQPVMTATPTPTATPVPPRCSGERFSDVCPGDYFYTPVLNLNDRGVVSGYNSSPPCESQQAPCFRPYANITRGQAAKLVALASAVAPSTAGQIFEDVSAGSPFYNEINALANRGFMSGYPCGGALEPCIAPQNRPYFRPGNSITRGQLSKIVSNAAGYAEAHTEQTFEDVPTSGAFYIWIQRLVSRGIISGYACGGLDEPCNAPASRGYFRPNREITRGQTAKIVYGVWPSEARLGK